MLKRHYKYAGMIENSRGKEFSDHVKWLFRLEIIEVTK